MRKVFANALTIMTLGAIAAASPAFGQLNTNSKPFNIERDEEFPRINAVISAFVKKENASAQDNHFCAIGYRVGADKIAWVYWREGNRIILWEPQSAAIADLSLSIRSLDLSKDVVPSENMLDGSTYLVTQGWVSSLIGDCERIGTKVSLKRISR